MELSSTDRMMRWLNWADLTEPATQAALNDPMLLRQKVEAETVSELDNPMLDSQAASEIADLDDKTTAIAMHRFCHRLQQPQQMNVLKVIQAMGGKMAAMSFLEDAELRAPSQWKNSHGLRPQKK